MAPSSRAEADTVIPEKRLVGKVSTLARDYAEAFQHPESGVLYGARLSGRKNWTSPEDVLREKPHPWGYGSRIADTVLHTGHLLAACLDAHEARPDPFLREQIARLFAALRYIGDLPESHPKTGKPALVGLVPRGPHPDDASAYYDDSSMDQHTTYIIALATYAASDLATAEERAWIRGSLNKVGRRLEKHGWSIKRADGVTQAHVGFSWKGFNAGHVSILLPAAAALHRGTGDDHWRDVYETFLTERDGKRWELAHAGPHVRINGHPIYANQNAFRVHAWHRFESDPERRRVIRGLLKQSAEMQLGRDFPGEFYRKYHSQEQWRKLGERYDWGGTELRGAMSAWEKFDPRLFADERDGLAALAHVRFPLGGFHMALLSESPELIRAHLPAVWRMLDSVDLKQVEAGETHYLFTVVALHLYALYFRSPGLFADAKPKTKVARAANANRSAGRLAIAHSAGIGPVMDVAVSGDHAYAIGRGSLHALDISDRARPRRMGRLLGLGSVRQIEVQDGVAYVTSRQDGLHIVDVSNPAQPRRLAHYDTIEFATGVAVGGDILYVACRHYGVELIDVSDPEKPAHISMVRTGEAQSVTIKDSFLYVGVWATSEVVVVDVSQPRRPRITSKVRLDGYGDGVAVKDGLLFAATGHHSRETPRRNPGDPGHGRGHGLEIFDLKDPAQPRFVSRLKFPPLYEIGYDMWSVTVSGDHAFVADTHNGAFVVNVSDPKNPVIVDRCELPIAKGKKRPDLVGGLAVVEGQVYLAGAFTDLHVAASYMAQRAVVESNHHPAPPSAGNDADRGDEGRRYRPAGQVHAAALLAGDRALVACGSAGVHVISLKPEIRRLSVLETEGFATDVAVVGNRVYVAEGTGGLSICELTPEGNRLRRLGRHRIRGRAIRQVEAPAKDGHVLVQSGANHFGILDASDPANVVTILDESRHGLLYGDQMMRGLTADGHTCVFWHVSGLHWYDLSGGRKPAFSGDNYPERIGSSNGLAGFRGKTLATIRGGYLVLDRNERRPAAGIAIRLPGSRRVHLGVPTVDGDRLYTANRAYGIVTIADISDPAAPKLIRQFETPGNPCRVVVGEGTILIPNGNQGLLILDR